MNSTQTAVRVNESILARSEKRLLGWFARRMPAPVNSDHLTALGLFGMLCAGLSYWAASANPMWLWAVNVSLVVNWFGDSLDGTVARVRNCQRPRYGYYIDHIVDAFASLFLFGGMALSGLMHPWVAVALLMVYYLLSIESYLATHSLGEFHISHFGFGPTELRILIIVGNCFALWRPVVNFLGTQQRLFDVGGAIAAASMFLVLLVMVGKHTATLYRQETR